MGTYVAFLRGMNLGRRRIRNDELCACFEALGFGEVWAFLASGNVVFASAQRSAPKLEAKIERGLGDALGYAVPTYVRSATEVAAIASHAPFDAAALSGTTGNLQVAMLGAAPSAARRRAALSLASGDDRLAFAGRELYWLPRGNLSDSALDLAGLGKLLGSMTIRTQRTLLRLRAKLGG